LSDTPEETKRSMRLPMLVLAILAVLLAGVWWHIRSQHHPSLPLTAEVVSVAPSGDDRVNLIVRIHGLTETERVRSDIEAADATGPLSVVGSAMQEQTDGNVLLTVALQPTRAEWVSVNLTFSHFVAAVTPMVDRLLHLAPRREQIGQVTLLKVPLATPTPAQTTP